MTTSPYLIYAGIALILLWPMVLAARDGVRTGRSAIHIEDNERLSVLLCTAMLQFMVWQGLGWNLRPWPFVLVLVFAVFWMLVLRIALVALLTRLLKSARGSAGRSGS